MSGEASVGTSLAASVLGVADLEQTIAIYHEGVGLDVLGEGEWSGQEFSRHLNVPTTARARFVVFGDPRCEVGRIVALRFDPSTGSRVRTVAHGRVYGLVNLNIYVRDIHDAIDRLERVGCQRWSEPLADEINPSAGVPTLAMIDALDGIILNLVELTDSDGQTKIGQMRRVVDGHGYTSTGMTPVATTQHCVSEVHRAAKFFEVTCGMTLHLEATLDSVPQNLLHRYHGDTRSRVAMMAGDHFFGKVAIISPENHTYHSSGSVSSLPAIGYLALSFRVPDVRLAHAAALNVGGTEFSPVVHIPSLPAMGPAEACIVRCPGSDALVQLIETSA